MALDCTRHCAFFPKDVMADKNPVVAWLEYGGLRIGATLLNALPYRVALCFGCGVAWFMYSILRLRRKETAWRIREVFGASISERRVREIGWISLRNLVFMGIEVFRMPSFSREYIFSHMEGSEAALARVEAIRGEDGNVQRGVVLGLAHCGNWNFAACGVARAGLPIFTIAAKQRNAHINDWMVHLQERVGVSVIERGKDSLREALARLRRGEILAIMTDIRQRNQLHIPFLGRQVELGKGMAAFARGENIPVLPVVFHRVGWTRFRIVIHDPVYPDPSMEKEADILRITTEVIGILDKSIRDNPEQWFWYNGRWITDR